MAYGNKVLYASGIPEEAIESALLSTLDTYQTIRDRDSKLAKPIIDRELVAVTVALKPNYTGSKEENILAVAQIGDIDNQQLYETFALKAVSRAFIQQARDMNTDVEPMEKLAWLSKDRLYEASSASVNGLHVGFAGGWAHHGRLLAVTFASGLAESLDLPVEPSPEAVLFDEADTNDRLTWLNNGQDSGDNTPLHILDREQYRFIFNKIVPYI